MKIPRQYADLQCWLKSIIPSDNMEDYLLMDYMNSGAVSNATGTVQSSDVLHCELFTKDHVYTISAKAPIVGQYVCQSCGTKLEVSFIDIPILHKVQCDKCRKKEAILTHTTGGYLGCIVSERKPRAGESWTRGNDLADGDFCEETWLAILRDIVKYEMVKIASKIVRKNIELSEDMPRVGADSATE